ncbi:MAG TPA: SAF domain-containing protein [Acidimicrobiia bacterium]|nr:SAF domain-containing protein [Acidimicrobiia bacterium]
MDTATIDRPERIERRTLSSNGDLRVVPVRSPINVPWVVVGILLVAGSALAFAVMGGSGGAGQAALALVADVRAGETITEADLRTVRVDGSGLEIVAPAQRRELVGRVALTDLKAGAVISESLLAGAEVLAAGEALVGIRLDSSSVPIAGLRPGDHVMVVRTPGPADVASAEGGAPPAVWKASVFGKAPITTPAGDAIVVSLAVDALDAPAIVAAAAVDRIRLALVRSSDDIPPQLLFADVIGEADAELPA